MSTNDDSRELKNITIMTTGSRGDIQPYIAIAVALQQAGYSVTILTNNDYLEFCGNFGVKAHPMYPNNLDLMKSDERVLQAMADGDVESFFKMIADLMEDLAGDIFQNFSNFFEQEQANDKTQLVICGSLTEYFAYYAWMNYGIPFIHVHTVIPVPNSKKHAFFGFPSLPFGLHSYLLKALILPSFYKTAVMTDKKAKKLVEVRMVDDTFSKLHIGVSDIMSQSRYSKEFLKPAFPYLVLQPSFWKPQLFGEETCESFKFVGPAILDLQNDQKLASDDVIDNFLQADPSRKPVYCGWGSMVCKSPSHMVVLVVKALCLSQQRGIVLGGFANLSMNVLIEACTDVKEKELVEYARSNILFVQEANHQNLFPRVSCTVHHGGQGTLATALRAGVPTIITPVFLDQWDSAHLVETMGNGIGFKKTQLQKLTASQLAEAITQVINSKDTSSYQQKAKEIQEEMMREENNGASNTVSQVQNYWKDVVLAGEMNAEKKKLLSQAGYQVDDGSIPMSALAKGEKSSAGSTARNIPLLAAGVTLLSLGLMSYTKPDQF